MILKHGCSHLYNSLLNPLDPFLQFLQVLLEKMLHFSEPRIVVLVPLKSALR